MQLGHIRKFFIISCLFVLMLFGCAPHKSGLYLSVEGRTFSDSEVVVDNKSVGRFSQMIRKNNGEAFIDGKDIGFPSPKKQTEERYSGSLEMLIVNPGHHQILFVARNGVKVEIDAVVPPGENYVVYSSEKGKLIWNNTEYKTIPGQKIIVRGQP